MNKFLKEFLEDWQISSFKQFTLQTCAVLSAASKFVDAFINWTLSTFCFAWGSPFRITRDAISVEILWNFLNIQFSDIEFVLTIEYGNTSDRARHRTVSSWVQFFPRGLDAIFADCWSWATESEKRQHVRRTEQRFQGFCFGILIQTMWRW